MRLPSKYHTMRNSLYDQINKVHYSMIQEEHSRLARALKSKKEELAAIHPDVRKLVGNEPNYYIDNAIGLAFPELRNEQNTSSHLLTDYRLRTLIENTINNLSRRHKDIGELEKAVKEELVKRFIKPEYDTNRGLTRSTEKTVGLQREEPYTAWGPGDWVLGDKLPDEATGETQRELRDGPF